MLYCTYIRCTSTWERKERRERKEEEEDIRKNDRNKSQLTFLETQSRLQELRLNTLKFILMSDWGILAHYRKFRCCYAYVFKELKLKLKVKEITRSINSIIRKFRSISTVINIICKNLICFPNRSLFFFYTFFLLYGICAHSFIRFVLSGSR